MEKSCVHCSKDQGQSHGRSQGEGAEMEPSGGFGLLWTEGPHPAQHTFRNQITDGRARYRTKKRAFQNYKVLFSLECALRSKMVTLVRWPPKSESGMVCIHLRT